MIDGWIALHRKLFDKAVWKTSTPEQKVVLITVLLMADHKGNQWEWKGQKFTTKPGQMVTSSKSIINNAGQGISRQNVRSALKRFEKYDFLTYESTKQGLMISIVNWHTYQDKNNSPTKNPTKAQPRPNQSPTTNNNVTMEQCNKEQKNNTKKISFPKDFELDQKMIDYCLNKSFHKNPDQMFEDFKNNHVAKGSKFVSWSAAWQTWCRNDAKFNQPKKGSMKKNGFTKGYYNQSKQTPRRNYSDLCNSRAIHSDKNNGQSKKTEF